MKGMNQSLRDQLTHPETVCGVEGAGEGAFAEYEDM